MPKSSLFSFLATIRGAESQHVEFKAFVRAAERDRKTIELLKVVCAFANQSGGSLFIGINDDGDVVGTAESLLKDYARREKTSSSDELRDAYRADVIKVLNEGLHPQATFDAEWLSFSALWVLRVRVQKAANPPVHLAENGTAYRRVGGTNRKMRAEDLVQWLHDARPSI